MIVVRNTEGWKHRRREFCTVLLGGILIWNSLFPLVSSQDDSGFISIDCGGPAGIDPLTQMTWSTDEGFLGSASQLANEGVAVRALVRLNDSALSSRNNPEQLKTAMAFIPGRSLRSKFCYNFTVNRTDVNSTSYLLRATFPSSNLTANVDNPENLPLNIYGTRFYFTVDSTFISTIELEPSEEQTLELVVPTLDTSLFACLVPLEDRSSMPAISSLELRPLSQTLYPRASANGMSNTVDSTDVKTSYLMLVSRLNFGANASLPAVRYPDDLFDRLWYAPAIPEDKLSEFDSKSRIVAFNIGGGRAQEGEDNGTPDAVMNTAWEGLNMSSEISFSFDIAKARAFRPVPSFYMNMMFLDVNPNDTLKRFVDVNLEHTSSEYFSKSVWAVNASVKSNDTSRWYNYKQAFYADVATFKITPSANSMLPAMVNAVEVLGEFDAVTERTDQYDVSSVKELTGGFADEVDTAGDPCLPVPWDWIVCNIEIPPRITQINLTSKGLTGELKFDERGGSLYRLTVLDVSNNSFHGSLPGSLPQIVTLRALNVEQNNLSGELPDFEEKSLANLESISLRGNSFNGSLMTLIKALDDPVFSLDLSSNQFTGSIPVEIGQLKNLKSLDLSYNSLTGTLNTELMKLPLLKNLNLRNNALTGMVPDEIWSSGSKSMNVDLRRNRFTGLNLTTWATNVLANKSFDADQQQVSLVANDIIDIILPSHDLFEQLYSSNSTGSNQQDAPTSSTGFILVGGNPWCAGLARTNMSLVQRYLCRSSVNEDFLMSRFDEEKGGVSTRTLIIVGVTSGMLVLAMACIVFVFLWRMGRRMYELRQIQEELARDDVRPPFYKYEELKAATRDFAQEYELGKGAFGAVYKAVLSDGSVVAVKRLFSSEQNVADFLKEMVLISGIKHRNLILLKGCCVRDKKRMLVYEYAENKNLAQALWGEDRPFDLTWEQRLNICVGIARGLSYLHEELQPKIIHRDIKPQNILLDKDWNAKIADFGLARPIVEDVTQMATQVGGTLGYFSPEYATLGILSEKLDIYSYGILLLEIISGRRCINLRSPVEEEVYLRTWAFRLYGENKLLDLAAKDLVTESSREQVLSILRIALLCLQEDPSKRPVMSQVVSMLTGSTQVAIDIVTELREQRLGVGYYSGPDDTSTTTRNVNSLLEREDRALLNSASWPSPSRPSIQLSWTKPR